MTIQPIKMNVVTIIEMTMLNGFANPTLCSASALQLLTFHPYSCKLVFSQFESSLVGVHYKASMIFYWL